MSRAAGECGWDDKLPIPSTCLLPVPSDRPQTKTHQTSRVAFDASDDKFALPLYDFYQAR